MRFLADESCDVSVVRALRVAGHDVLAVGEIPPSVEDEVVIDLAVQERRILLTEDKDFGQLVFAATHRSSGVILLRFPARARTSMAAATVDFVSRAGEQIVGLFVVLQPGRVRVTRAP